MSGVPAKVPGVENRRTGEGPMTEVEKILNAQHSWIRGRCQRKARDIRHPSYSGDDLADELLCRTVLKFLDAVRRGWFDQEAHKSRTAQARNALSYALRQAVTDLFRDAKKAGIPVTARKGDDDVEADEGPEELPGDSPADDGPLEATIRKQRVADVLDAVRHLNPGQRLYLLATYFPDKVLREHVEDAHSFAEGGARVVVRDPKWTWECFYALRCREEHLDEARWKKLVAELFRLETPLGEADPKTLKRAVSAYDQRLTHARRAAAEWLRERGRLEPGHGPRGRR